MSKRIIWLFILFFLCSASSVTYTFAMTEEYASADEGQEDGGVQNEGDEYVANAENAPIEDEATFEMRSEQRVQNIVDNLLNISDGVGRNINDPKTRRLLKEQNISKQIDRLRADIKDLEKTLNSHYADAKKSIKTQDKDKSNDKSIDNAKSKKSKVTRSSTATHRTVSSSRNSNSYLVKTWAGKGKKHNKLAKETNILSHKIHTVKNISINKDTNEYIERIQSKNSAKATSAGQPVQSQYRIKCHGKNGSCGSPKQVAAKPVELHTKTIKPANYFNPNCSTRSCG